MHIDTIRTMGRAAQGVKLINLKGTAAIAAVARVPRSEDEEAVELDENGEPIVNNEEGSEGSEGTDDNNGTDDSNENGTDIENDSVE